MIRSDSAEAIAAVVGDLRAGRTRPGPAQGDDPIYPFAKKLIAAPVVVDATEIYRSLVARDDPVAVYEDHPCISPPWEEMAVCYHNEHGNVVVMHATVSQPQGDESETGWEPPHPVEWGRVRWVLNTFVWVGGHGAGSVAFPTSGPMHLWRFAIYDDGEPADLHWVCLLPDYPLQNWDMAHLVLLGSLNFLNCRNVSLVEPRWPRAA